MMRQLSWSMRFALAVSAVFAAAALLAGGISYQLQTEELVQRLESEVQAVAESLAQTAKAGDRVDLVEQVVSQSAAVRDGSNIVAFIDGATGETVGNIRLPAPFEGARRVSYGRDLTYTGPPPTLPPEQYFAFGIKTGMGWIIAGRDDAWIRENREVLLQSTAWGLGLALALSVSFAVFIARRNEVRIARMELILSEVGAGAYDLRIREAGNDDLSRLAAGVDATLDRLEAGITAIRQVSTDVAHDLRAPLSRLRLRLEPHALDMALAPQLRDAFGSALAEIDGISQTFDAILRLSRLQAGMVEPHQERVDLGALARDIHDMLSPTAEDQGQSLTVAPGAEPTYVTGDIELLSQAVINLVDNALRHCPADSRITISVSAKQGHPTIAVRDDGPGIPAEARASVRERFVRLDRSRNTEGTGLGLSLVSAIATLHGAELVLTDNAPGLYAQIVFPTGA